MRDREPTFEWLNEVERSAVRLHHDARVPLDNTANLHTLVAQVGYVADRLCSLVQPRCFLQSR
ncbi:MAG: hypothetical protein AB7L94_40870 [Kofleriaceae bacterium]